MIRLSTDDGLEIDYETSTKEVRVLLDKLKYYSQLIGNEGEYLSQKITDDIADEINSLIDECKKISTRNTKHTPIGFNYILHVGGNIIEWD